MGTEQQTLALALTSIRAAGHQPTVLAAVLPSQQDTPDVHCKTLFGARPVRMNHRGAAPQAETPRNQGLR
jgi:hypothetical protein